MVKRLLTTLVVSVLLVTGIAVGVWSVQAQSGDTASVTALPVAPAYQPNTVEEATAALYEQVTPSVVNISVVEQLGSGTGSGFVIDDEGHIVTNNHVTEGAEYIEVTFVDGTIVEADLVGADPDADLAVIKVDPSKVTLHPIEFADSDQVFIGQQAYAIGSPYGQDFTLTTGIVSALDRSLRNTDSFSIPGLIQTDAAINPGNSGGPLLDGDGHVIGVNSAILSESGSNSGIGLAIPSNTVRRIVPYLISDGKFEHSWLGIAGSTLRSEQREAMDLSDDVEGVMVSDVSSNGPAGKAGLKGATEALSTPVGQLPVDGDIIVSVDGEDITQMDDLIAYLEYTMPGDEITLGVLRDGEVINVAVTLQPRP